MICLIYGSCYSTKLIYIKKCDQLGWIIRAFKSYCFILSLIPFSHTLISLFVFSFDNWNFIIYFQWFRLHIWWVFDWYKRIFPNITGNENVVLGLPAWPKSKCLGLGHSLLGLVSGPDLSTDISPKMGRAWGSGFFYILPGMTANRV